MEPKPIIRECYFEDHPQINALGNRYGLVGKNYEEWKHLWIGNPVYNQFDHWPIGWVLENSNKVIVGYIGNVPLSYEFGGRQIVATTGHAMVVDSQYRTYSLPLLSQFFNQKKVELFTDTTVNSNASKAHQLFKARRVPAGEWDESSFWITNYEGFIASVLDKKGLRLLKPLAYPLSLGLRLARGISKRTSRATQNGIKISSHKTFDQRFDEFWHRLRRAQHNLLLATRSRDVLEWHFQKALAQDRAWVLTASDGSAIIAYAIFQRDDKADIGLKRLRLVDFQTLNRDNELLAPLLSWALEQCTREKIHMLEAIGFRPEKQRIIDELTPRRRKLSSWLYFYKTTRKDLAEALQDSGVWDPCCFDGDASL
jgi:hypothetical protein